MDLLKRKFFAEHSDADDDDDDSDIDSATMNRFYYRHCSDNGVAAAVVADDFVGVVVDGVDGVAFAADNGNFDRMHAYKFVLLVVLLLVLSVRCAIVVDSEHFRTHFVFHTPVTMSCCDVAVIRFEHKFCLELVEPFDSNDFRSVDLYSTE